MTVGRKAADLSKIAAGEATVLFLADIPDQVRLLTIDYQVDFMSITGDSNNFPAPKTRFFARENRYLFKSALVRIFFKNSRNSDLFIEKT